MNTTINKEDKPYQSDADFEAWVDRVLSKPRVCTCKLRLEMDALCESEATLW